MRWNSDEEFTQWVAERGKWYSKHQQKVAAWKLLGADTRVANSLAWLNIQSIDDLAEKTADELMELPNFGKKSLQAVQDMLHADGKSLRLSPPARMSPEWQEGTARILREHGWTCTPPISP